LILFEGGLLIDLNSYKKTTNTVRNILSFGVIITVLGSAAAAHYLLGVDWMLGLLYGAFMSNAGVTVINPILDRVKIKSEIGNILRAEGILTKPIGTFIAIGLLEIVIASSPSVGMFFYQLSKQLIIGVLIGYLMGFILGKLLKKRFISTDLKNLVVLAWVFGTYFLCNLIEKNTGALAVVMAGFAVQRENIPQLSTLKKFKGQLSILAISVLFIVVSANMDLATLLSAGWKGLLVVMILIFIIRPIAIFFSSGKELNLKEKIFVSWIGPKGVVATSIASLTCLILKKHGIPNVSLIESVSYLTVFITVLLQGSTAKIVAEWCGCLIKSSTVMIVGANALGRILGTAFKEIGRDVVLIDNNPVHCKLAEEDGLTIVQGNALDMDVLEGAGIAKTNVLIATTANSEVNFLVSTLAKEEFRVAEVYPAIDAPHKGVNPKLVDDIGGNLAYAKAVSIQDWKDAAEADQVKIEDRVLNGSGQLCNLEIDGLDSNNWIPLILKRKDAYYFVHADQNWSHGDILVYLSKE
jgi:NhaP-type Na+/H+ or K+/H+ antiporter